MTESSSIDWPQAIFEVLRAADIRQVGYVPDAGHSRLISLCHGAAEVSSVVLTTEEEGIGLAAGQDGFRGQVQRRLHLHDGARREVHRAPTGPPDDAQCTANPRLVALVGRHHDDRIARR